MSNAERLIESLSSVFPGGETELDVAALERLIEALRPLAAEGLTGSMTAPVVDRSFVGLEGLRSAWGDWLDSFARVRFEIEGLEEIGENVVVQARQIGTTRHGVDVEQPSAAVWKFREGQVVRIEFHLDREAAQASARAGAAAG